MAVTMLLLSVVSARFVLAFESVERAEDGFSPYSEGDKEL